MDRLWHIPPLQLQKIVQGSWRLVHPQLPFLHAKFEPHPDRISFSICYGTRQTPSATVIAVRVLLLSASQPYSLGQVSGDSESRATYQCPHWKWARLAFCLNTSVVAQGNIVLGHLRTLLGFFFAGGTHSWLHLIPHKQQSWTWLPHSPQSPKGCPQHQALPCVFLYTP